MDSIASIRVSDVLRERNVGEPVNVHVVQLPREPTPDYQAMQELITGNEKSAPHKEGGDSAKRREVPPHG
jgi:hypothetical protein